MKVNRDLLLSAFITLCIHAAVLVGTNAITTTPVEYSVQKAPSSVEVTLVKKEKKKEVKKQKPKVEKKVEVKEPEEPKEKKKEKPEKKVEKKVAKKELVKNPEPVEEKQEKEVKEEKTEPEPVNKEKIEKDIEELVQNIEKAKEKEPEPEVSEKSGTPVQMPAYLNNKPPEYPSMARKRGFEGKVILRVRVLSSGNPQELEIKDSSGYEILDEAALEAVEKWKFKPATRGGSPVDSWVEIPIRFELRDT